MINFEYVERDIRYLRWSLKFKSKTEEEPVFYSEHRGDGAFEITLSEYGHDEKYYSFLDNGTDEEVDLQMLYINNVFRAKSDII